MNKEVYDLNEKLKQRDDQLNELQSQVSDLKRELGYYKDKNRELRKNLVESARQELSQVAKIESLERALQTEEESKPTELITDDKFDENSRAMKYLLELKRKYLAKVRSPHNISDTQRAVNQARYNIVVEMLKNLNNFK